MNDTQLGGLFRAVRIHLRLRQEDVAAKARVSQSTVSRIERGHIGTLTTNHVRAVAGVLEIRLDVVPSWRGGDLERLVNARHTALHEQLTERMAGAPGWESAAEVSFSIWGDGASSTAWPSMPSNAFWRSSRSSRTWAPRPI